eukprot:jgi/Astpho2/2767/Aster-00942
MALPGSWTLWQSAGQAGAEWLDADGLLSLPTNATVDLRQRIYRPLQPLPQHLHTVLVPSSASNLGGSIRQAFRLDIAVGQLEFAAHPLMPQEQWLAASLFRSVRDFKRRGAAGLLALYTGRLAAQQRALLAAREEVFAIPEDAVAAEAAHIVERCTQLELEVAATRQMLKEEEMGRLQALQIMQGIAQQLQQQRQDQGFSLTSVNLRLQQCGASMAPNGQLAEAEDAEVRRALQAAEAEAVAGMPPPPVSLQELLPEQGAFRLQRVECTCAAHASLRRQLLARLQVLQDRLTADEQDEVCSPELGMACWCDCPRGKCRGG